VVPARPSFTRAGAAPATRAVPHGPPVLPRHWKLTPLPGVTTTSANVAPAPVPSRNMTPALAHGSVLTTEATRATMVPSPVSAWLAKLNWSDAPQMSRPPPLTVQLWPSGDDADPAFPGPPTSASAHPAGTPCALPPSA